MLSLRGDEKVHLLLHKHWFELTGAMFLFLLALIAAPTILTLLPFLTSGLSQDLVEATTDFALSLYIMILLVFLLHFWADYYLDMWIITNERIIAVEQHGLFRREISEIPLEHVQDVTLEVTGVIETFLKFGTIKIQTAGEREFTMKNIPRLYEAKDLVLKYSREQKQNLESRK